MKNKLIIGPINTGKTKNGMFKYLKDSIENSESILITDNKREYINTFYDDFKKNGYNILIIDFKNPKMSECFNPLSIAYNIYKDGDKDFAIEILENIASSLIISGSIKGDPFWERSAADLFIGIVLALFDKAKIDEINFSSVFSILDTDINKLFSDIDKNESAYIYASNTINAPLETKGSIIAVLKQLIRLYTCRENLSSCLSYNSFSIEDVISKKTVIFLINHDDNTSYSKLSNTFISVLYKLITYKNNNDKFSFYLDNFELLGYYHDLKEVLAVSNTKNISFYLSARNIEEFENMYSKYILELVDVINSKNLEENKVDSKSINIEYTKNKLKKPVIYKS